MTDKTISTSQEGKAAAKSTDTGGLGEARAAHLAEAGRTARSDFVRNISAVIENTPTAAADVPHAFTPAEKAETLRKMADQVEREAAGNPVQRSQDRVAERDAWPNRQFFQNTPAQPSPEMRDRWLADGQARNPRLAAKKERSEARGRHR